MVNLHPPTSDTSFQQNIGHRIPFSIPSKAPLLVARQVHLARLGQIFGNFLGTATVRLSCHSERFPWSITPCRFCFVLETTGAITRTESMQQWPPQKKSNTSFTLWKQCTYWVPTDFGRILTLSGSHFFLGGKIRVIPKWLLSSLPQDQPPFNLGSPIQLTIKCTSSRFFISQPWTTVTNPPIKWWHAKFPSLPPPKNYLRLVGF